MTGGRSHAPDHDHGSAANAAAAFRARGRRLTHQRGAIWRALAAGDGAHLSVDDIVQAVLAETPFVNISTVYRTLQLLVAEGLVRRADLGTDRAYYELAHEHRHHHVVCDRCGAVAHLHDDVLGDLAVQVRSASGYELTGLEITLRGLCDRCRSE